MRNLKLFVLLCVVLFTNSASAQNWLTAGNTLTSTGILGGNSGNYDIIFKRNGTQAGLLNVSLGNTSWGVGALSSATTGANNTANGYYSLSANTTGSMNVANGYQALNRNLGGSYNLANGYQALLYNLSGNQNVADGYIALKSNTTGSYNVATGAQTLSSDTSGSYNVADGAQALYSNISGSANTANGFEVLYLNTTGSNNVASGYYALDNNTGGSYNTGIGYASNVSTGNLTNATALGAFAKAGQSNSLILGGTGTYAVNVGVGTSTPNSSALLDLTSTTQGLLPPRIALTATNSSSPLAANVAGMILYNTATAGTSPNNVTPGYYYNNGTAWVRLTDATSPGWSLTGNAGTNPSVNFIGTTDNEDVVFKAGNIQSGLLDLPNANTSWGYQSFNSTSTGQFNTAIGAQALAGNTTGEFNVANGFQSMPNNTTGSGNVCMGQTTLYRSTTGGGNTAIGNESLYQNTTGTENIGLGDGAGFNNTTGTYNTAVGVAAGVSTGNLTNTTAIGNNASVGQSNSMILGGTGTYAINVGVGTPTPNTSALLDLTSTTQGLLPPRIALTATNSSSPLAANVAGMILYNTATAGTSPNNVTPGYYYNNGTAWVRLTDASSPGWSLTGNAGTTPGTNFIGTTDDKDVIFKVNNTQAGLLDYDNGNTSWGAEALGNLLTGTYNTASGYQALYSNQYGSWNTAIGYQALYSNTGGLFNVASGFDALYQNTTGGENVAVGQGALFGNTTGSSNVAIGGALGQNTTGGSNIGIGAALLANTTASSNVGIGDYSLYENTTGYQNVALGVDAGFYNATGYNNVSIGVASGAGVDGLSNTVALGDDAVVTSSNEVLLGNSSTTELACYVGLTVLSDGRFKKNIQTNVPGLNFIKQLKPVTYNYDIQGLNNYIAPAPNAKRDSSKLKSIDQGSIAAKEKIVYTGFVAQDVEAAANKSNYDFSGVHKPQNGKDAYGLDYSSFVPPLVKAVQELSTQNDSLQSANTQQQAINAQQQQANNNLQQQLNDLKTTISQMQTAMSQCCNSYSSNMAKEAASPLVVTGADAATLQQNTPNPYTGSTVIAYHLPQSTTNAEIIVSDLTGSVIRSISLTGNGDGQITLSAGSLASGSYFYTLLVNGQKIDTKQMIIAQ